MVRKKDGKELFCIDYRKLNAITKKDVFPLPRCDEILESLSGAAYFTHLDMMRGYWQIKVAEQDREKNSSFDTRRSFSIKENAVLSNQCTGNIPKSNEYYSSGAELD